VSALVAFGEIGAGGRESQRAFGIGLLAVAG
jgi:hypothetical protein